MKEFSGSTAGGELNFEYAHNQTTLTDHNGNKQIMQFNNFGNTVSVQDGEGRAQYAQYAANDPSESGKANQLRLSSKMQNTVTNLLQDHSFESSTLWTAVSGTRAITTAQKYLGSQSLSLTNDAEVKSTTVSVPAGETYTFSAYLKTSGTTAVLKISDGTTTVSSPAVSSTSWTRSEVSFTNNGSSAVSVTARVVSSGTGTTYVDCVQMENAPTASRYNLIQSSDFQSSTGWSSNNGRNTFSGVSAAAPQLNNTVYKISGSATNRKRVYQTVTVSGAANDTFVLSGWGKGDSVPLPKAEDGENQRQFAVVGVFNYTDGSTSDEFIAQFNPDTDSSVSWQFASQVMVAKKAYSSIKVTMAYDYNLNTAYFDGIQLFKERFGNSYTYDADGNIKSVTDLQKQTTSYEYDTNNNLTKIIQDNKAKMTYTYEGHNVVTATSEEGLTYNFTYDGWGNNTSVSIVNGGTKITSTADYTNNGNYLESTTDAVGNTTYYGYNANTGVLAWVKYPGDTNASRTNYTYDSMYRMASAAVTTDTNANLSAAYTYTNDLLTKITTGSTTYDFTYGAFALRSSVKIGERTLASYSYTTDRNNYLNTLAYGNGDSVQYTYDDYGRVTKQTYEDGSTVSYKYDNTGALATVTDSSTGVSTTYYYDFTDRLMRYVESGNNYSHIVGYKYDNINNLTSLVETIDGVKRTTSYTYDDDNRVTSVTNGKASKEYTYDAWGRSGTQITKHNGTTLKTDTFVFNSPTGETTSTQIKKHTVTIGTTVKNYEYTYDANGNITRISDGTNTTTYAYDSANQLIRENNQAAGFTHVWTYDNAGNILSRTEYTYTTATTPTNPTGTFTYGYEDPQNWGDLLTSYDGQTFTYDNIGNLTNDGTWDYTWQHGRQLASMDNGTTEWEYTYNADGLRTQRTDGTNTYSYVYNGDKLSQMTINNNGTIRVLRFIYDASGLPVSLIVKKGSTTSIYYYVTNVQGDVVAILNSSGTEVVTYSYDAWGNILSIDGSYKDSLGIRNPLRYRGYVYDTESGLYYLQSRYYDPNIGRFINADVLTTTGQGLVGNNMFTYCLNNPINFSDSTGYYSEKGLIIGTGLFVLGAIGMVIAAPISVTVAATAIFVIGASTVTAAIKESATVIDLSYSKQTEILGYEKAGVSIVTDFETESIYAYSHTGYGVGYSNGLSFSAGSVENFEDPTDFSGDFVSVNGAFSGGIDHAWSPGQNHSAATQSTSVTFSSGPSGGVEYSIYSAPWLLYG